jgi:MFS transporter, OFA family, oxalate/formate antiporter
MMAPTTPEAAIPAPESSGGSSLLRNRWVQLTAGILGMVAVANFQYSWTLFVPEIGAAHGWNREAVQLAFFLFFVPAQTWLVPLESYLAERFGLRLLLLCGGSLAALGWVISSRAESLAVLYAAQGLCGCASGIVYGISVGSALKWFPDRRGLAAGLTAAAFGAGSAATVLPISLTIENHGYQAAFLWFGLGQGLVVILTGLLMRFPRPGEAPLPLRSKVEQSTRDYTPREVLQAPVFWLLYAMMTMGAIPGLLMAGQLKPMARDFGLAEVPVTLLGMTLAALTFALMIDRILGGLTRPVFGWVSDYIGRERSIFLAFALEGTSLLVLILCIQDPVVFVVTSGVAFFGWGAIFSLFPALAADLFGRKFAATNYGLLYTAKGTASLLILFGNHLQAQTGSWTLLFGLMIAFDWIAALLAILVLPRMRRSRRVAGAAVGSPEEKSPASEPGVKV